MNFFIVGFDDEFLIGLTDTFLLRTRWFVFSRLLGGIESFSLEDELHAERGCVFRKDICTILKKN